MTKELLTLALEAVEIGFKAEQFMTDADYALQDKAVAALREALAEQPAQQEPVAWMHTMIDDVVIGHRPADIARHPDRWMPLYKEASPCPTCEALARTVMLDQTSHDAQRTWIGLTDREIDKLWDEHHDSYGYQLSVSGYERAIEAKLKEKNT